MSAPAMEVCERDAIVASLKNVEMVLAATGKFWLVTQRTIDGTTVDYIFSEDTIDKLNITTSQRNVVKEEEGLNEFFETPEEAADFYLKIADQFHHSNILLKREPSKEKIKKTEKDAFFE